MILEKTFWTIKSSLPYSHNFIIPPSYLIFFLITLFIMWLFLLLLFSQYSLKTEELLDLCTDKFLISWTGPGTYYLWNKYFLRMHPQAWFHLIFFFLIDQNYLFPLDTQGQINYCNRKFCFQCFELYLFQPSNIVFYFLMTSKFIYQC